MRRFIALSAIALLPLTALSGCLGILEDEGTVDDEPETGDEGDPNAGAGDGDNGTDPSSNETRLTANLAGNVSAPVEGDSGDEDNQSGEQEGVAANLTLFVEADENQSVQTTTDAEGAYSFEDVEPGAYTLRVEAGCCETTNLSVSLEAGENKSLNVELERRDEGSAGPQPAGGTSEGTSTGVAVATLTALSSRATFVVEDGNHTTLELIPEFADPLAENGQSYLLRVYYPDESEEDHTVTNDETVAIDTVMEGEYQVNLWPVAAGSYTFEIQWCVFTDVHCQDA